MARKQFVSSKKNAPSRAVSSKEAALQGRAPSRGEADSDEEPSMNDDLSRDSDISSVPSSPISSDEEDAAGSDGGDMTADPADSENDLEPAAVTVQVMPASVGRGKQLRFPTGISRGKEIRSFNNGSPRDGSDSESYASVASDDEEEPHSGAEDDTQGVNQSVQKENMAVVLSPPPRSQTSRDSHEEEISYPIKASRARKRHRPDSGYFSQMSTHVRDCLLSVRDSATASTIFSDDVHDAFRRKLSNGTVERVQWKEASPPPASDMSSKSEKKPPKTPTSGKSSSRSSKKLEDSDVPTKPSSGEISSPKKRRSSSVTSEQQSAATAPKRERLAPDSLPSDSQHSKEPPIVALVKAEVAPPAKQSAAASGDSSQSGSRRSDPVTSTAVCARCQSATNSEDAAASTSIETQRTSPVRLHEPSAISSFIIPPGPVKDATQLQTTGARLLEEARLLKHEGNRRGKAEPGSAGQTAQGISYLRSSAKFFQHALVLADLRAVLKDAGDERSARSKFENCILMLGQTTSLIRSTVTLFHNAGNRRLVGLGYKLAAITHLTIYRLQHQRLFAYYSDLSVPTRSPDSTTNGSTPPITGSSSASDARDGPVRALLVKEMEHTVRGFEMWQRYEALRVEVLPRITNPVTVDLSALFEDLTQELDRAERERAAA